MTPSVFGYSQLQQPICAAKLVPSALCSVVQKPLLVYIPSLPSPIFLRGMTRSQRVELTIHDPLKAEASMSLGNMNLKAQGLPMCMCRRDSLNNERCLKITANMIPFLSPHHTCFTLGFHYQEEAKLLPLQFSALSTSISGPHSSMLSTTTFCEAQQCRSG